MTKVIQIEFEVRSFLQSDLDALEQIEEDAGDSAWSRAQLELLGFNLEADTRIITAPHAFGQPIGFYVVVHGDKRLYLSNIAIAKDWRRCGAGSFALLAAEKLARELTYQKLALDVNEENLPAQLLYRKAGFKVRSINPDHYKGQDGFYMEKDLQTH